MCRCCEKGPIAVRWDEHVLGDDLLGSLQLLPFCSFVPKHIDASIVSSALRAAVGVLSDAQHTDHLQW